MADIEDMWLTPVAVPNGLSAASDGLWVIDSENNHLYKLAYDDGSVLLDVPTETIRSSGLTLDGSYVWVASTHSSRLYKLNQDGSTVEYYDSPGRGIRDPRAAGPDYPRPHGMEWVDGKLWVSVKPALRNYLVDPESMEVLHSIPTPGARPHGIFWHEGALWCADTGMGKIHKLDPHNGEVMDEIDVPEPTLHGMTLHEGNIWFCSTPSRRVCRIVL